MVHEITREPFDRGRVLARRHVDDIVLHEIGERAGGQAAGHLHRPRLEQEREPAAGPGPRGGHRPRPMHGARDAGHDGVDERLVPEEVRMPPHTPPPVMHRAGVFPAARLGTMEAGAGLEADHDAQLPPAAAGVTEAHGPTLPR